MLAIHLKRGRWAEDKARDFLVRLKGMRHLSSNYRCRQGEIDLIMEDGEYIVFVEVRYRKSDRFGGALASIDSRKQQKLRACAELYRQRNRTYRNRPCRFDVVSLSGADDSIEAEWVRDAF